MLVAATSAAFGDVPTTRPAPATQPAHLFDPARHMHVSEVKPGMTGYGLTVFSGTKIEKFDVEVISILKNFNPQYDVVLIRCKDSRLEHTGSIQGMSGSPIFLKDDSGRERMIGAFAYGWPMTKDPIAGVQPIEYMLDLPPAPPRAATDGRRTTAQQPGKLESSSAPITWSLIDADLLPHFARPSLHRQPQISESRSASVLTGDGDRCHVSSRSQRRSCRRGSLRMCWTN